MSSYSSVKRNLKVEANVIVSECTACYHVIIFYILFAVSFNAQNTELVTVLTTAAVTHCNIEMLITSRLLGFHLEPVSC